MSSASPFAPVMQLRIVVEAEDFTLNSRLDAPAGLQITLFEELEPGNT